MSSIIDLEQSDDPQDVIHRTIQQLVEGELVGLPGETGYFVAGYSLADAALEKMASLPSPDDSSHPGTVPVHSLTLSLKMAQHLQGCLTTGERTAKQLFNRCWPGPVLLKFHPEVLDESQFPLEIGPTAQRLVGSGADRAWWVPASPVMSDMMRLLPVPLVVRHEAAPVLSAADLEATAGSQLATIIDSGPPASPGALSVVRIDDGAWSMEAEGVVSETVVNRLAGRFVVFVCTGNTCRSPMAEAIFRKLLAERVQCRSEELTDRGYTVLSAGIAAPFGSLVSENSVVAVRPLGIDLSGHLSQPLTEELAHQADWIYTMTRSHREMIVHENPHLSEYVKTLSPEGLDIIDPIGGTLRDYERCRDEIRRSLESILEMVLVS